MIAKTMKGIIYIICACMGLSDAAGFPFIVIFPTMTCVIAVRIGRRLKWDSPTKGSANPNKVSQLLKAKLNEVKK